MGVAPVTISPFGSWLITTYDWRTAMLVIGIGAGVLLIPASLLVRPAPQAAAALPRRTPPRPGKPNGQRRRRCGRRNS